MHGITKINQVTLPSALSYFTLEPSAGCQIIRTLSKMSQLFPCQRPRFLLLPAMWVRKKIPVVEVKEIDNRLDQLLNFDKATNYSKQKDSLKKELQGFLTALPGYVTVETITPRDLCRFLIFKDKDGKTQVHRNGCRFLGQKEDLIVGAQYGSLTKQSTPI